MGLRHLQCFFWGKFALRHNTAPNSTALDRLVGKVSAVPRSAFNLVLDAGEAGRFPVEAAFQGARRSRKAGRTKTCTGLDRALSSKDAFLELVSGVGSPGKPFPA